MRFIQKAMDILKKLKPREVSPKLYSILCKAEIDGNARASRFNTVVSAYSLEDASKQAFDEFQAKLSEKHVNVKTASLTMEMWCVKELDEVFKVDWVDFDVSDKNQKKEDAEGNNAIAKPSRNEIINYLLHKNDLREVGRYKSVLTDDEYQYVRDTIKSNRKKK